jgi:Rieske Fe-S protein
MPDRSAPTTEPAATTRRTVLRAAGLAALTGGGVAVLGACTAEGEPGTPTSSAPATSASSAPATSSAPAESPSASAAVSESTVPSGPGVATSDVPVGGGVILDDADYVITQPTAGEFKAFSKICTHQGCPVTEIAGGTINCKCHGSKFSIEDGSVSNPPASKALKESKVTVVGDKIYVSA